MTDNTLASAANTERKSFESLDLDERILRGIRDLGFETCSPIQGAILPPYASRFRRDRQGPNGYRQNRCISDYHF